MSEGLALQLTPLGIGVTVVCPGWVRTRISESGRNRPERYGPTRAHDPASPHGAVVAAIAALVQSGLDPSEIARRVLAAVRDNELYVITHPEMHGAVEARFAAIRRALDKASGNG